MSSDNNKLNKAPLWANLNFLIWVLPIAGYLMAMGFDIGYLSGLDIPLFFAELNFYSVTLSSTVIFFILLIGACSILSVAELEAGKHWLFPTLFNTPVALGVAFAAIYFYFDEDLYVIGAFWMYVFFNSARVYNIYNDKSSDLSFSDKIRKAILYEFKPSTSLSNSKFKAQASSLLNFLCISSALFLLAIMAGNSIANRSFWRIEGHENTIAISRNNNLYIEKKYDPQTKVLERGNKLISANEGKISIVPVEPGLKLHRSSITKRKGKSKS